MKVQSGAIRKFTAKVVMHMKITITGRQLNVWDSLKELITEKLAKLDRYFDEDAEAYVTCRCKHDQKIIEITISYHGTIFRSEERDTTFQNALDTAMDTLDRQIRKNKTRLEKRMRENAFQPMAGVEGLEEPEEETEFRIRTKTFPFKPMTVEEAILQMNLLEHQFFVFVEAESGATCVVYKRLDGDNGLIMPE